MTYSRVRTVRGLVPFSQLPCKFTPPDAARFEGAETGRKKSPGEAEEDAPGKPLLFVGGIPEALFGENSGPLLPPPLFRLFLAHNSPSWLLFKSLE